MGASKAKRAAGPNREARRAHLQPPPAERPVGKGVKGNAKPDEDVKRFWIGRCECADCNFRPFPLLYTLAAYEHRRKDSWHRRRANIRTGHTKPIRISYECLLQSMYGLVRRAPKVGSLDTTESASAQGIRWLEDRHAGGVNVDPSGLEMESESELALLREIAMYESLGVYLDGQEPTLSEEEKAGRIRRCRDLCAMWPGDRNRRRLYQWLRAEFLGWLP